MPLKISNIIRSKIQELCLSAKSNITIRLEPHTLQPEIHLSLKNLSLDNNLINKFTTICSDSCAIESSAYNENVKDPKIIYKINKENFIRNVLTPHNVAENIPTKRQNIIVEFSSPNIAKPFHVGHLRSTIIGNFISNLFKNCNHNVVRLNYLGDWGTQFGYLKVGVDYEKYTEEDIQKDPINLLYQAYVKANELAEKNSEIHEQAKQIFSKLESDEFNEMEKWQSYKNYTVDALEGTYRRLGIVFDEYCWESDYNRKAIQNVIKLMESKNILEDQNDGRRIVNVGNRRVSIIKSDGSTLYLTRDVAALIDRQEKHNFDQMYYVVDNAQRDHFKALFDVSQQLNLPCSNKISHVQFGRIHGMSTRKGTAVFLKDILDEAKDRMKQQQLLSLNTKTDFSNADDNTSDVLGITAVIINDLKQRRSRDYEFSWESALQSNGDTGIKLQYTHCRLWNLKVNSNSPAAEECIPQLLLEHEAIVLIIEICKFQETLKKTEESLEACILVNYLFGLCNAISKAFKVLNVKNEPSADIRSQRLLLFNTARDTLNKGMRILGLQPLLKM